MKTKLRLDKSQDGKWRVGQYGWWTVEEETWKYRQFESEKKARKHIKKELKWHKDFNAKVACSMAREWTTVESVDV